ncbi:MAG: hypothetical protein J6V07_04190 [Clostridia bacterium]|nr:hypothetical protein [Clostridia bacterium]
MDIAEKIFADLRLRIRQLAHIGDKVKRITRYAEFPEIRLFARHLEDTKKKYEGILAVPGSWLSYDAVLKNERVRSSVLFGWRLDTFVYEVRYERMALRDHGTFFGFYNPDPFLIFGLPEHIVYGKGYYNGAQSKEYFAVLKKLQENPSLIPAEREKVTAYLRRGCDTPLFRGRGLAFPPIDLTVPGGY